MNLLIIDDHPGVRELIRWWMRGLASCVQECASGEEAIEACKSFAPDWVTVDLHMGDMDGLTTVRLIREAHPHARIAVVTQFTHERFRARASQAGADAYIAKDDLSCVRECFLAPSSRAVE